MQNTKPRNLFLLAVSLLLYSLTASTVFAVKNQSGIHYSKKSKYLPAVCKIPGNIAVHLSKLKLNSRMFVSGANCVVGDFDGNGYIDFFIYGKPLKPGNNILPYPATFLTLFYRKNKIIRSILVDNSNSKNTLTDPVLYPATKKVGEFGEPASDTDGIIQYGEGGSTIVLLYNRKSQSFKHSEHASEHH